MARSRSAIEPNPAWYRYWPQPNKFDAALLDDPQELVMKVHRLPFVGARVAPRWAPVRVSMISEDTVSGDFPSLMDYYMLPLVTERAWRVLEPLIGRWVEPLAVEGDAKLHLLNVVETVDCIDRMFSEFDADEDTGRISVIFKYSFLEDLMNGRDIVKTPRQSGAEVFVSQRFRELVEGAGLRGLAFRPLPRAEHGHSVQSSVAPDSPSSVAPPSGGASSSGPRVNAGIGQEPSEEDPDKDGP